MSRLPNYGLSLSHDFSTRVTSAFLCCTHMFEASSEATANLGSPSAHIGCLIKNCPQFWSDPLFLPSAIISHYSRRLQRHASIKHDDVTKIESQLGVSKSGKLRHVEHGLIDQFGVKENGSQTQTSIRQLIKDLSTIITETIYFLQACDWVVRCSTFLEELGQKMRMNTTKDSPVGNEMQENLAFLMSELTALTGFYAALKSRAELQLSTVSTSTGLFAIRS